MNDADVEVSAQLGPVVFQRLRVEAFRGFNRPVDIDLSASVVLVHGPNGMGKTSLFDALQWVLLGDLPRLRTARLRPSDEYIVNAYRAGDQATVQVQVLLHGQSINLSRTGDRSSSVLTWESPQTGALHGPEAERAVAFAFGGPDLDLASSLNASGLLQQDAAREVLSSKPRDRFDTFSQLLGLGELARFQQWAQGRDAEAAALLKRVELESLEAERESDQARYRLAALRENAAARPAVADVARRLEAAVQETGLTLVRAVEARDDATALVAFSTTAAQETADMAAQVRRLQAESRLLTPGTEVDDNASAVARLVAERELASARAELARANDEVRRLEEVREGVARMASAVLSQIAGPTCPACGQHVDEGELRQRLIELEGALSTTDAQARATERAQTVALAEARVADAIRAEQQQAAERTHRQTWQRDLDRVASRFAELAAPTKPVRLPTLTAPLLESAPVLDAVADETTMLAALARELVSAWDASVPGEEARAASDAEQARVQIDEIRVKRESVSRARKDAAALFEAVRSARLEVVRREFDRLSPLAQDIYSRLDPHPTFRDIDLVSDLFRSVGTTVAQVRDTVSGVAADPMIVFSSAQANIAAISYVMALNAASSVGAPILLLDDPVQAMDDVNVLGFADLCRHVRQRRQVFVSTHERRFAHLLERKLAPRRPGERTVAIEFVGWDRGGPTIKHRDVTDQLDLLAPVFSPDAPEQ